MNSGRRDRGARLLFQAALALALAHPIPLERAKAIVLTEALGVVTHAARSFGETRAIGPPESTDTVATCRRAAEHLARCRWGAASFWGESYAIVCVGRAEVRLVGRQLLIRAGAAACQH